MVAALLAHQGGWDEMLMVAGPILVFALILRAANRRAERMAADTLGSPGSAQPTSVPHDLQNGESTQSVEPDDVRAE